MRKLVVRSIETDDGARCVDIFQRGDGSFGFEIYRQDPESLTGWFAIGGFADKPFPAESAAHEAAARVAPWLSENS